MTTADQAIIQIRQLIDANLAAENKWGHIQFSARARQAIDRAQGKFCTSPCAPRLGTTRLRPHDWKSGDKAWVVEVVAPFGGGDAMVADLKAQVFKERELRVLVMKDGKRETTLF